MLQYLLCLINHYVLSHHLSQIIKNAAIKSYERCLTLHKLNNPLHPPSVGVARCSADETVECIRQARISWEMGINEELQAIAKELKRPFLLIR